MPSTVHDLFASVGADYAGAVQWGEYVPLDTPGVYIVSTSPDPTSSTGLTTPPLDPDAIATLLEVRPEGTIDSEQATHERLTRRFREMWPSGEPVVYVGLAGTSVQRRVEQFYRTPIGARAPHAGGWPVKMLTSTSLWVHFGTSRDVDEAESGMLRLFVDGLSDAARRDVIDTSAPLPFANLTVPRGPRKAHGLRGFKESRQRSEKSSTRIQQATASTEQASAVSPGVVSGVYRPSQNVTPADLRAGKLRVPRTSKSIFPSGRAQICVEMSGERFTATWDPGTSGDKERSGVIRVGRAILQQHISAGGPRRIEATDAGYKIT
ncbi:hypothetical protein LG315_07760 [Microbacterium marinum]|uniref:hypothetical protein n=1 Tax=Microbacterium marinum TaxID=421115 RepID=UPI00384F2026